MIGIVFSVVQIVKAGITGPNNPGHPWIQLDKPADCSSGYYVRGADNNGWLCDNTAIPNTRDCTTYTVDCVGECSDFNTSVCTNNSAINGGRTVLVYSVCVFGTGTTHVNCGGDNTCSYDAKIPTNCNDGSGYDIYVYCCKP